MTAYLGMNFDSEEVALERVQNIYTDKEFNVELPTDSALFAMPNMFWTRVCVHIFVLLLFPSFFIGKKQPTFCFLSSLF